MGHVATILLVRSHAGGIDARWRCVYYGARIEDTSHCFPARSRQIPRSSDRGPLQPGSLLPLLLHLLLLRRNDPLNLWDHLGLLPAGIIGCEDEEDKKEEVKKEEEILHVLSVGKRVILLEIVNNQIMIFKCITYLTIILCYILQISIFVIC